MLAPLACDSSNDPGEQQIQPIVSDHFQSDCLQVDGEQNPAESTIEVLTEGDVVTIVDHHTIFNCCLEAWMDVQVDMDQKTILVVEVEQDETVGDPCDCECAFELSVKISDLVHGTYAIDVYKRTVSEDNRLYQGQVKISGGSLECAGDDQCGPEAYCDPCASSSCPQCDDCLGACVLHGCQTEAQAICDMVRPSCEPKQVSVIRDGCWKCVLRDTCYPIRDDHCDDGTEPVCDMIPPVCNSDEILAYQDNCYRCVNPDTCDPWGEPPFVVSDHYQSECLDVDSGGNQQQPNIEVLIEGEGMTIVDHHTLFNCCLQAWMEVELELSQKVIQVVEVEQDESEADSCNCVCAYEISVRISGLEEGTYTIEVYKHHVSEDTRLFQGQAHVPALGCANGGPDCEEGLVCCGGVPYPIQGSCEEECLLDSDRNIKQELKSVDANRVLEQLAGLSVTEWSYTRAPEVRHIGPMAQDFHSLFKVGVDNRHIHPIDANGVTMVAIQALYQRLQALENENASLREKTKTLQEQLQNLIKNQ